MAGSCLVSEGRETRRGETGGMRLQMGEIMGAKGEGEGERVDDGEAEGKGTFKTGKGL